ncbi:hypothetical protein [Spartinivicinus ruber]|uniref:hypothetical protein n=1 Tax=Spartinivicinus ruber TaxID=2683272 RepID=UPI0013D4660E|nr:hypothetical protein [Spartinivicinus ruber]
MVTFTSIIAVTGLMFARLPFIYSLKPNAKADAALPRIDVSDIKPGTYIFLPHPIYGELYSGYSWSVMIYRKHDGTVKAWDLTTRNGAVGMPDLHWWRPFYDCKQFGPTVINGEVQENLPIQCHDADIPSNWWANEWRWNISGKNLGKMMSDLNETVGVVEGKYFVFAKRH